MQSHPTLNPKSSRPCGLERLCCVCAKEYTNSDAAPLYQKITKHTGWLVMSRARYAQVVDTGSELSFLAKYELLGHPTKKFVPTEGYTTARANSNRNSRVLLREYK